MLRCYVVAGHDIRHCCCCTVGYCLLHRQLAQLRSQTEYYSGMTCFIMFLASLPCRFTAYNFDYFFDSYHSLLVFFCRAWNLSKFSWRHICKYLYINNKFPCIWLHIFLFKEDDPSFTSVLYTEKYDKFHRFISWFWDQWYA